MTHEELLRKWGALVDRSDDIFTWTERLSLCYLAEQASGATFAVELGVYLGRSSKVMLEANPNLHLWAVDTFYEIGIQKTAEYWLKDFISTGRCELIKGDSARAASMLPHMKDKLDFVWIDDGHAEEDLRRDIDSFRPLMRPGSLMFGHDWDGNNDVARGVKSMIYEAQIQIPVPRVWAWPVQALKKKCC